MKIKSIFKFTAVLVVLFVLFVLAIFCARTGYDFNFVFMTDIHLQPEKNAVEGFEKAIASVNVLSPDFVITGGDLIMDALAQDFERADMLYNLYKNTIEKFEMPVYNTIGNHEIFGLYKKSGIEPSHPEYGRKMFKKRLGSGKTYYSFDYKNWHFLILDSVGETENRSYYGWISEEQIDWIKDDLSKISKDTPIAISVHIPFFTILTQVRYGSLEPNGKSTVINNSKEVFELFNDYNLRLVLQGHLHILEYIYVKDVHFITSGAVSGSWWDGAYYDTEEGYLLIKVKGDNIDWEYIDYGWQVEESM